MIKKIGLYGGAFDPIHQGHLIIANEVKTQLNLDEVWLVPTFQSPLKSHTPDASTAHRLSLLQLATQQYDWLKVNTIEITQSQISYTYNTVKSFKKMYPEVDFYFIIGGDRLIDLDKWYKSDELLQLITFVAVKRPHFEVPVRDDVLIVEMPLIELSSTIIRNKCQQQHSISFLLPYACEQYIKEHKLYETITSHTNSPK